MSKVSLLYYINILVKGPVVKETNLTMVLD